MITLTLSFINLLLLLLLFIAFLKEVRCHEGQKSLAIAIELSSMMSHSSWVIYCLRDYPSLADLYVLLQKRLQ